MLEASLYESPTIDESPVLSNVIEQTKQLMLGDDGTEKLFIQSCETLIKCVARCPPEEMTADNLSGAINIGYRIIAQPIKKAKFCGYRILCDCLKSEQIWLSLMRSRLDFFIIKCIESEESDKKGLLECIKLLDKAIFLSPKNIPISIIKCICAQCCYTNSNINEHFYLYVSLLCDIVLENPKYLVEYSLSHVFLNLLCTQKEKSVICSLVSVLTYSIMCLDQNLNLYSNMNIFQLISPFNSFDAYNLITRKTKNTDEDIYHKINFKNIPKNVALKGMLVTWDGLFHFGMEKLGFKSTILHLPYSHIKFQITFINFLYEMLDFSSPILKDLGDNILSSLDIINRDEYTSSGEIMLSEILAIKPPSAQTINLWKIKKFYLLLFLYHCDLIKSLLLIIQKTRNMQLLAYYTIFLAEFIFQVDQFIPKLCLKGVGILDLLESSSKNDDFSLQNSQFVLNLIGTYSTWKSQNGFLHNLSIPSLEFVNNLSQVKGFAHFDVHDLLLHSSSFAMDESTVGTKKNVELNYELEKTNVLNNFNPMKWNWNTIYGLLNMPSIINFTKEENFSKLIKLLLQFYTPCENKTNKYFVASDMNKIMTLTGFTLFNFLSKTKDFDHLVQRFFEKISKFIYNNELEFSIVELSIVLGRSISDYRIQIIFSLFAYCTNNELHSDLIHQNAIMSKIFLMTKQKHANPFTTYILPLINYSLISPSLYILKSSLGAYENQELCLFATKMLRVFLRHKIQEFEKWGMTLLKQQLHSSNYNVVKESISIFDEAFHYQHLIEKAVELKIDFYGIKKSVKTMTRMLSNATYLQKIETNGYLDKIINMWKNKYYGKYPEWVSDLFSTHVLHSKSKYFVPISIFPPAHLYGELCETVDGYNKLQLNNIIENVVSDFLKHCYDGNASIKILPSIWAIAHIGSKDRGIQNLLDSHKNILEKISILAKKTNVLYLIKGTCIDALSLISLTEKGKCFVSENNWCFNFNDSIFFTNKENLNSTKDTKQMSEDIEPLSNNGNEDDNNTTIHTRMGSLDITIEEKKDTMTLSKRNKSSNLHLFSSRYSTQVNTAQNDESKLKLSKLLSKIKLKATKSSQSKKSSKTDLELDLVNKMQGGISSKSGYSSDFLDQIDETDLSDDFIEIFNNNVNQSSIINTSYMQSSENISLVFPENYTDKNFIASSSMKLEPLKQNPIFDTCYSKKSLLQTMSIKKLSLSENNSSYELKQMRESVPKDFTLNKEKYNCVICGENSRCGFLLFQGESRDSQSEIKSLEVLMKASSKTSSPSFTNSVVDGLKSEVIKAVYCAVSLKKERMLEKKLLSLKSKTPNLFSSLCLYDKCMYVVNTFDTSLPTRKIIHRLFDSISTKT